MLGSFMAGLGLSLQPYHHPHMRRGLPAIKERTMQQGFNPSESTRKDGKVRADLVMSGFPLAIMEMGRLMGWALEGKGYKEGDFKNVPDAIKKYRAAMYRHDLKETIGPVTDDESGLHHAVHTAWNAMARLEVILMEQAK